MDALITKPTKSRTAQFYAVAKNRWSRSACVIFRFWYILKEQPFYIILKFGTIFPFYQIVEINGTELIWKLIFDYPPLSRSSPTTPRPYATSTSTRCPATPSTCSSTTSSCSSGSSTSWSRSARSRWPEPSPPTTGRSPSRRTSPRSPCSNPSGGPSGNAFGTGDSLINPFRTKTPNIYSQEEINLYCIIKLASYIKFLYFHYKSVKLDVLCRQNKIWKFGNPFQSKKLPICT